MAHDLVGTWHLETWTALSENGDVWTPLGERPLGLLVITADGWLSAHCASRDRSPFKATPLGDYPFGEPAEQAGAFATYMGYAGPYRREGNRLVTTVEVCWHPNFLGTEQPRDVELTEDLLVLRPPLLAGASHELHWRRITGPADNQAKAGES